MRDDNDIQHGRRCVFKVHIPIAFMERYRCGMFDGEPFKRCARSSSRSAPISRRNRAGWTEGRPRLPSGRTPGEGGCPSPLEDRHKGAASRLVAQGKGRYPERGRRRACCGRHLPGHHPGGVRRLLHRTADNATLKSPGSLGRPCDPSGGICRTKGPLGKRPETSRRPERCP